MSTDRGDSVDPNDPYRPAQPDDTDSARPVGYDPATSGSPSSPSGYETPGTGPGGQQVSPQQPYASYGEQPYAQQPYGQQPAYGSPPPSSGTDGFAIAALVTGILMMAIVPIVLGIVALNRINRSGQEGRGLAIAGIVLGAISVVGWLLLIIGAVALFSAWETTGFETYGLRALAG
jgi:hypothetical protein